MPRLGTLLATAALLGVGCTGQVANTSDNPGGSGANPSDPGRTPGNGPTGNGMAPPGPDSPGVAIFHRLSRVEYNNTVRDLLGDTSAPAATFPPDEDSVRSGYVAGGTVAVADAVHLLDAAEALAAGAVKKLPDLLPCKAVPAAVAEQDACAQQFITRFGARAFRRPLSPDEVKGFSDLYAQQKAAMQDFPNAIRVLITGFLMSPQFLYRWEVNAKSGIRDGAFVRYSSYEMASRLSYLIWASMPDDASFAAAEQNKLVTPEQIEAEARRMLKDPKAKTAIADFFTQWLGVTDLASTAKDPKAYPDFSPTLANAMVAETGAFAAASIIDGDGKLATVFTSTHGFADTGLAKVYGVTGGGGALSPVTFDPGQRSGILTQAAFLTQHANAESSNPVRRGKTIADRVICVEPPAPPDNVPDPKPPAPNLSVRERFAEHDNNPCAMACHNLFDPIGYAFENYNGIGAYQTMDGGKPVDATGTISLDGKDHAFKNAIELGGLLAGSQQVGDCMARQFLRYALRRKETAGDEASIASARTAFASKGNDLRELLVGLTRTRAFTHRTLSKGEVLP